MFQAESTANPKVLRQECKQGARNGKEVSVLNKEEGKKRAKHQTFRALWLYVGRKSSEGLEQKQHDLTFWEDS